MATEISDWSSTAGDNDASPPNGAPEGMAPSAVNNVIRQNMKAVRDWYVDPAWIDYGYTYSYASGTSFTVDGANVTADFPAGRRVRAIGTSTGTIYGTVSSSSFSTDTTVNVTWDSGTLSNETLAVSVGMPTAGRPIPYAALHLASMITLADMASLAQATVIGRVSGAGTGVPQALTAAQLATIAIAGGAADASTVIAGSLLGVEVFTSSGTYTRNDDATSVLVISTGGGAGGGVTSSGTAANGNDTTFGSHHTAGGGLAATSSRGGIGGSASGATINCPGGGGGGSTVSMANSPESAGAGGASFWGSGGPGFCANSGVGSSGLAFGSGGGGAIQGVSSAGAGGGSGATCIDFIMNASVSATETVTIGDGGAGGADSFAGGDGADGICIVLEFG